MKLGIIGAGHMAQKYLEVLTNDKKFEVNCLCSRSSKSSKKLSSKFGIPKSYTDLKKMLNDNEFDALIIAVSIENTYKISKYILSKKIPLHDGGTPVRNWLHAYDTAQAVITIIEAGVKNEIYNVCGGYEQTNLDTVNKIITLYYDQDVSLRENFPYYKEDRNHFLDLSYSRQGQDVRYALNDDKLRNIGWSPKKVFDEELPEIVKYYKENFIW